MSKRIIWVLMNEKDGYVLFHGNPNPKCPPYQLGGIESLLYGKRLVWGYRKYEVERQFNRKEWRKKFPLYKIKAKKIVIRYEPYEKSEVPNDQRK